MWKVGVSTLRDWLKKLAPLFHKIRRKTKTNRDSCACVRFPAFRVSCMYLLHALIGYLDFCVFCDWLGWLFWFLFLLHSTENRPNFVTKCWEALLAFFQLQLNRLLRPVFWRTWLCVCHEGCSRHAEVQQWVDSAPEGSHIWKNVHLELWSIFKRKREV